MPALKFLAIGDLHIQENNIHVINELKSRVLTILDKHELDFVVLMGDTLHTHQIIHTDAMNCAQELIRELSSKCPVYVLIGNHDLINHQQFLTNRHGFNALKDWKGVTIVDEVVEEKVQGKRLLFLPYVPPGTFVKALNTIGTGKWKKADLIFAHQEFKGCIMGAFPSEIGDEWSSDYPPVISGHIHDAQTLDNGVIYVGTPMQHGFGDTPDKTIGYFVLDEKLEYQKWDLDLPRKYTLKVKLPHASSDEKKVLEKLDAKNSRDIYKVVIIGSNEQFVAFRKSLFSKRLEEKGINPSFKPSGSKKALVELPTTLQKDDHDVEAKKVSFFQILKAFVDESDNKYIKKALIRVTQ